MARVTSDSPSLMTSLRTQVPVPGSSFLINFFSVFDNNMNMFHISVLFLFLPPLYILYRPSSSSGEMQEKNVRGKFRHEATGKPPAVAQVKSSQGLLFAEAKKTYAEAVGQTGAQGLVRGCGSHCPPVSRKNLARDEASGAPRAGRGSAGFSGLISGVRVLSPALSGGLPEFRGGLTPSR